MIVASENNRSSVQKLQPLQGCKWISVRFRDSISQYRPLVKPRHV
jgi:hypothetical protein